MRPALLLAFLAMAPGLLAGCADEERPPPPTTTSPRPPITDAGLPAVNRSSQPAYDPSQFPPWTGPPAPRCPPASENVTGAPADEAIPRLLDLGRRAHSEGAACDHVQAWRDYLAEPQFAPWRPEAALAAAVDASLHGDSGSAEGFFAIAEGTPWSRRVQPDVGLQLHLRTFYDADRRQADANRSSPAPLAAAVHHAQSAFGTAAESGNDSWYRHGLEVLDAALTQAEDPVSDWILRMERGDLLARLPPRFSRNLFEERAYTFRHPVGAHLNPAWATFLVYAGATPEGNQLLRDEYVRFTGTTSTYHFADHALRWDGRNVPFCFTADAPEEFQRPAFEAAGAWDAATGGDWTFHHDPACAGTGGILVRPVAGVRSDAAPHWNENRILDRCDVQIQTDVPGAHLTRTFTHEFGHCLGLDHSPFSGDMMSYHGIVETNQPITSRDVATLRLQWDAAVLNFSTPYQPDYERANLAASETTDVKVEFYAELRRGGADAVLRLYFDADGDRLAEQVLRPGERIVTHYRSFGPFLPGLDVDPTFNSPSLQTIPITITG